MMKNPQESQNYAEIIQKIKKSKTKPFHQPVVGIILTLAGIFSIIAVFIIILFLARESVWFTKNPEGWTILDMLFTNDWHPERVLYTGEGLEPTYGAIFIIAGSLLITIGAMMFAVPLGIGCAIFVSEIAPPKLRVFLKTGIELLAGIPSIVYGFIGLRVFTPFLQNIMPNRRLLGFTGDSWLAASILLGIMALPTIVSVTEDSLRAVPREYKEASLAMGATKWQTIRRVQVPSAISGITAAVILGMGRAIGETMAVMFVAGNSLAVPEFNAGNWWNSWGILERLRTITATLGIELKEVPWNTPWYGALFMLGVILFVITLIINTLSSVILKKINERFQPPAKDDDLDKEALGNIAFSVAYLPKSIKNRRVDENHGLKSPEIDKIKHSFKKLGEIMRYFGFFQLFSGLVITLTILGVSELTVGTTYFPIYLILGSIFIIGNLIFLYEVNKHNLQLKKQTKNPLFIKFSQYFLIASILSIFVYIGNFIVLPILAHFFGFIIETGVQILFLIVSLLPAIFEAFAWRELRDFFYINPFMPKRRAAESTNLLFIGSIFSGLMLLFPLILSSLITIMSMIGIPINPDGTKVFNLLVLLVLSLSSIFLYVRGYSRTGRNLAEREKLQLNKKIAKVLKMIGTVILVGFLIFFGLFTFNWLVIIVLIPIIGLFPSFTKKMNQNVVQTIAYGVIIFCAVLVVSALGILIFNIYKEGIQILGFSIVIIFIFFSVEVVGLTFWRLFQPTKEAREKQRKLEEKDRIQEILEKKFKKETEIMEINALKEKLSLEDFKKEIKLRKQKKILAQKLRKQKEKAAKNKEQEETNRKKTKEDLHREREGRRLARESWKVERKEDIESFKKKAIIYACLILALFGITIPIIINNGFRWMGERGLAFIYQTMKSGGKAGGILNQIIGTTWLVLLSILIAVPIGIMAGIYLAEYAKESPATNVIRAAIDNLNGTPSIVFGLFGMGFFLNYLQINQGQPALIAGVLTMAIMVLPTIIRVTDEAVKAVPQGLKEGSYAIGATKWETLHKVVLPVARPGIITGVILSMGRVAGETAPIMFIAATFTKTFNPFPVLGDGVQCLPYHVLTLATEFPGMDVEAGATALILFLLVLILFTIATKIRTKYSEALK